MCPISFTAVRQMAATFNADQTGATSRHAVLIGALSVSVLLFEFRLAGRKLLAFCDWMHGNLLANYQFVYYAIKEEITMKSFLHVQ